MLAVFVDLHQGALTICGEALTAFSDIDNEFLRLQGAWRPLRHPPSAAALGVVMPARFGRKATRTRRTSSVAGWRGSGRIPCLAFYRSEHAHRRSQVPRWIALP